MDWLSILSVTWVHIMELVHLLQWHYYPLHLAFSNHPYPHLQPKRLDLRNKEFLCKKIIQKIYVTFTKDKNDIS